MKLLALTEGPNHVCYRYRIARSPTRWRRMVDA